MNEFLAAALESWRFDIRVLGALLGAAWIYWRGYRWLHLELPHRYPASRLASFLGGLAAVFIAVCSPLDAFGFLLLQAHMIQHMLLLMVAPPLILLGQPVMPLLRGLPQVILKDWLGPFLKWRALRAFGRALVHPVVCWVAFGFTLTFWHLPRFYELGLHSQAWHEVQHACFFFAAILFWWPVVQVWPGHSRWPRWAMIPYLVTADVLNTIVSAILTFSDHVIYPSYAAVPRLGGMSALDDQAAAGAIMWVPGSVAFLLPVVLLVVRTLSPLRPPTRLNRVQVRRSSKSYFDLLRVPFVGAFLRYRHFRRILQVVMFLLAAAVVADGLRGPQVSGLNLAGVLPWTYWRGLGVIALLAVGNLFCMACPLTLPRDLGRRFLPARYRWPNWLRSKWLAIVLLLGFLWANEVFGFWDSPWATAWIVIAYFATATLVDGLFQGASFCKYVCPIGQFHFVQSLVSPFEVKVRKPEVCDSCSTHSCLHGSTVQRGCELNLFQPKKLSSFDCTFCLDCVHSCSHGNVGLIGVVPAASIIKDRRLSGRRDVAVLAGVSIFGAFASAAVMTGPVMMWLHQWHARLGSMLAATTFFYLASLIVLPSLLVFLCGRVKPDLTERFLLALVPLGFSMWLAHFCFHLISGWDSVLPVIGRIQSAIAAGMSTAGALPSWLPSFEVLVLDAGLLLSLYLSWRIASSANRRIKTALGVMAPWATLAIVLYSTGLWILSQPMDMRGMVMR